VLFVALLEETKSGPHTALTATAIHITAIASDAHNSVTKNSDDQPRCSVAPVGGCKSIDI